MSSRQVRSVGNGHMKLNLDSVVKISPPLISKNSEQEKGLIHSQPQFTSTNHLTYPLSPPLPQKLSSTLFQNNHSSSVISKHSADKSPPSYKYDYPRQSSVDYDDCPPSSNAYVNLSSDREIKGQNGSSIGENFVVPRQLYVNEKTAPYDVPKVGCGTKVSNLQLNEFASASPPPKIATLHQVPDLSKVYVDVNYQVVVSPEISYSPAKPRTTLPSKPSSIADTLQYLDIVDTIPAASSKREKSYHRSYRTLPHHHKTKLASNSRLKKEGQSSPLSLYDKPRQGCLKENLDKLSPQLSNSDSCRQALTSLGQEEDIMKVFALANQSKSTPTPSHTNFGDKRQNKGSKDLKGPLSIIDKVLKRFTFGQRNGHDIDPDKNNVNPSAASRFVHNPTYCCLLKRFTRRRSKKESFHPCPKHSLKRAESGRKGQKFSVMTKVAMPSLTQFAKKSKDKRRLEKETSSPNPQPCLSNDGIIKKIMGRLSYHEIDLEKTEALRKMMLMSSVN